MIRNKRGISLIALIVTIIVIIILASIAITMSIGTPEQATYAKFCNDIVSLQDAVTVKTIELRGDYVLNGIIADDSDVYDSMTEGEAITVNGRILKQINKSMLKMDLPSYQSTSGVEQNWYLDINDGTVCLIPGYEYEGKEYITNVEIGGEVSVVVIPSTPTDIYVTLYTDGTLAFNTTGALQSEKTVSKEYGNIRDISFSTTSLIPWYANRTKVVTVEIEDEIVPTDMMNWFYGCSKLTQIKGIEKMDTSIVTTMNNLFYNCTAIKDLDLGSFRTESVKDISFMFHGCSNLVNLNVSSFDTENVENMCGTFARSPKIKVIDVSKWETEKVVYMDGMFFNSSAVEKLDLSNWNTINVETMDSMFYNCQSLTELKLSDTYYTGKVANMYAMFCNCVKLTTLDVSSFDTSKVTDMRYMFGVNGASIQSHLKEIIFSDKFNTEKVTTIDGMFQYCSGLTSLDLSGFNTNAVTTCSKMLIDVTAPVTVGAGWKSTMTESATSYSGTFTKVN